MPAYKKSTKRSTTATAERSASVFNETLTVDGVSTKFGNGAILVGKEWINLNDGVDLGNISKGSTYEFEIKMGTNGKRYINALVGEDGAAAPVEIVDVIPSAPVRTTYARPAASSTPSAKRTDQFRSPDEIKRSSAIGVAGGSEMYKKMLEDAQDMDDAKAMLTEAADFVLNYIENGSQKI